MLQKKIVICVLFVIMIVTLYGCGDKETSMEDVQNNINTEDMIYESVPVDIEGVEGSMKKAIYRNECLYFITEQSENQNTGKNFPKVYSVDIDGSHLKEIPLNIKENEYIDVFDMDVNGNLCKIG